MTKTVLKIYCDDDLKERLDSLARHNRTSTSALTADILAEYLEKSGFDETALQRLETMITYSTTLFELFLKDYFGPEGADTYATLVRHAKSEVSL